MAGVPFWLTGRAKVGAGANRCGTSALPESGGPRCAWKPGVLCFKVGETTDELRRAKPDLEALGVEIILSFDHTVSQSIYFTDPDGNAIEVYVDVSDVWRTDPNTVATISPLSL